MRVDVQRYTVHCLWHCRDLITLISFSIVQQQTLPQARAVDQTKLALADPLCEVYELAESNKL